MRPGKPNLFGRIENKPFLGLPGNPVSVAVSYLLFIAPALAIMQGQTINMDDLGLQPAIAANDLPKNDERASFLRAKITGYDQSTPIMQMFNRQDSAGQRLMADADGLIYRPVKAQALGKGESIQYLPFPTYF